MNNLECFNETPWETRNLKTQSFAVSDRFLLEPDFQKLDTEVNKLQQKNKKIFLFSRIPKLQLSLAPEFEKQGFCLVECTVSPYCNLNRNDVLSSFVEDKTSFLPLKYKQAGVSFATLERSKDFPAVQIKKIAYESFDSDRFHMDSKCPDDLANHRFSCWVEDLIADPLVTFDVLEFAGAVIAFMARKQNHLILAGFVRKYARAGMGDYLWLSTCCALKNRGLNSVHTLISINNLPVLNLYSRIGFKFRDTQYSFHYWGSGN